VKLFALPAGCLSKAPISTTGIGHMIRTAHGALIPMPRRVAIATWSITPRVAPNAMEENVGE